MHNRDNMYNNCEELSYMVTTFEEHKDMFPSCDQNLVISFVCQSRSLSLTDDQLSI